MTEIDYEIWCRWQDTGPAELEAMRRQSQSLESKPLVSILLACGELDELWVRDGIESVRRQAYDNWELLVSQAGSRTNVATMLATTMDPSARIREVPAPTRGAQTEAAGVAAALAAAGGDYVLVLGEGDELAPDAIFRLVDAVIGGDAQIAYADEDRIDYGGERGNPQFKPRWSPDLLLTEPYVGRPCLIRRDLLVGAGGLRPELGELAEYGALLAASERSCGVAHVPRVLYHRRERADGPVESGAQQREEVVNDALRRRGERVRITIEPSAGTARMVHDRAGARVSVIVLMPRRGAAPPIARTLAGMGSAALHELFVAGRAPRGPADARLVRGPTLAAAASTAAAEARGRVLVFIDGRGSTPPAAGPGWLAELALQALRPGVGAVSGRVTNQDGTVRHGGTAVDLDDIRGPVREVPSPEDAERLKLRCFLNPGAATEDLLAVTRDNFESAGGFDTDALANRFFGLDLALRLEQVGLRSVYTPYAGLHFGEGRTEPSREELAHVWRRWSAELTELESTRWPANDLRHRRSHQRGLAGVDVVPNELVPS